MNEERSCVWMGRRISASLPGVDDHDLADPGPEDFL